MCTWLWFFCGVVFSVCRGSADADERRSLLSHCHNRYGADSEPSAAQYIHDEMRRIQADETEGCRIYVPGCDDPRDALIQRVYERYPKSPEYSQLQKASELRRYVANRVVVCGYLPGAVQGGIWLAGNGAPPCGAATLVLAGFAICCWSVRFCERCHRDHQLETMQKSYAQISKAPPVISMHDRVG